MDTGTVKWFNEQKGYGFIQPDNGQKDIFVHISAVERAGLRTLKEGQKGAYMYVVKSGSVAITVRDKAVAAVTSGGTFGEMALVDHEPRSASAIARSPTVCVRVLRLDFEERLEASSYRLRRSLGSHLARFHQIHPVGTRCAQDRHTGSEACHHRLVERPVQRSCGCDHADDSRRRVRRSRFHSRLHTHEPSVRELVAQGVERGSRCRVAGHDDHAGPVVEQASRDLARELADLFAGPRAVRRACPIAEVQQV